MSEDIRKMINQVKNFKQFVNERNDLNVINESAKLLGIKIINYSGSKSCKNIFENNN